MIPRNIGSQKQYTNFAYYLQQLLAPKNVIQKLQNCTTPGQSFLGEKFAWVVGWVVVEGEFSVTLWSKPLYWSLSFRLGPSLFEVKMIEGPEFLDSVFKQRHWLQQLVCAFTIEAVFSLFFSSLFYFFLPGIFSHRRGYQLLLLLPTPNPTPLQGQQGPQRRCYYVQTSQ